MPIQSFTTEGDYLFLWEWREREKFDAKSPIWIGTFADYAPGSSGVAHLRFNCED